MSHQHPILNFQSRPDLFPVTYLTVERKVIARRSLGLADSTLVQIDHRETLLQNRTDERLHPCASGAGTAMEIKAHWAFALDMNIKAAAVGCLNIADFISESMGFRAEYQGCHEAAYEQYSSHHKIVCLYWTANMSVLLHL